MKSKKTLWKECRSLLNKDLERLERFQKKKFGIIPCLNFLDPSYLSVWLYRISRIFWCSGNQQIAALIRRLNIFITGLDVHGRCDIGEGVLIPAPSGVNLSGKLGSNFTILSLGGIGVDLKEKDIGGGLGAPVLGDNVIVHPFSIILGPFNIGTDVQIYPGSVATLNVPEGARLKNTNPYLAGANPPFQEDGIEKECPHKNWKITWSHLVQDNERYLETLYRSSTFKKTRSSILQSVMSNHFFSISLYRISHQLNQKDWKRLGRLVFLLNFLINKVTLNPESCIEGGFVMPHPAGIVFQGRSGKNLNLFPNSICSSLKHPHQQGYPGFPRLGNDVLVGSHAGIFGSYDIGDRTRLGMKARAVQTIEEDSLVFYRKTSLGKVFAEDTAEKDISDDDLTDPVKPENLKMSDEPSLVAFLKKDLASLKVFALRENPHRSWRGYLFPSFLCVLLFRLSHACSKGGWSRSAYFFWWLNYYLTGSDIAPSCEIGGGLCVPYPAGVSLNCKAGANLTVMGQSGMGPFFEDGDLEKYWDEKPQIGDDVFLGHHTGVYGPVTVGDRVHLDPGCMVMKNVEEGTYCAGATPTIKSRAIVH